MLLLLLFFLLRDGDDDVDMIAENVHSLKGILCNINCKQKVVGNQHIVCSLYRVEAESRCIRVIGKA